MVKKHSILFLALTLLIPGMPICAETEYDAYDVAATAGSIARNTALTAAGLTASTIAALATTTYTGARLLNAKSLAQTFANNNNDPKIGTKEKNKNNDISMYISLAEHGQNASAFIAFLTGIAGATATSTGIKGLVKDIKNMIRIINNEKKIEEPVQIQNQPVSHAKKTAKIAMHSAQVLGGMGTTALGAITFVASLICGGMALDSKEERSERTLIKAGMGLGTTTGLGLCTAGIATMVHGIKELHNDYKTL